MPSQHNKTTIQINANYSSNDRVAIAREFMRIIINRTNDGVGLSGSPDGSGLYSSTKKFPKYSNSYVNSKEFKALGKSRNVNLRKYNKMLNAMKLLDHGAGYITIGFENGSFENDVADGNITGSYGRTANPTHARNFLGITVDEYQKVIEGRPVLNIPAIVLAGVLLNDEDTEEEFDLTGFRNNG